MTPTTGNPFGAMALAVAVLLAGVFLAPRLFRRIRRGGENTAERVSAAASHQQLAPGTGMGTSHAGGNLAPLAIFAAASTIGNSPISEWVLGRKSRPLSPYSGRLMRASLQSADYQGRLAMDRANYDWAIRRRLGLRGADMNDPYGVANAADAVRDAGVSEAQLGSALLILGASQADTNLILRARADLFADTYTQRNMNVPVQRYLGAVRHIDGKQGNPRDFMGYLSVASVAASNLFSKSENPIWAVATPAGTPTIARFGAYLPGGAHYSPYVDALINQSNDRVALRAAIGGNLLYAATADERNAVAAYWSREAQDSLRAWGANPAGAGMKARVDRARESIRNIELEAGPKYASPFTP